MSSAVAGYKQSLGADAPPEIALSILAQIVAVRRGAALAG